MSQAPEPRSLLDRYDVRFDAAIESIVLERTLAIHGSLVHLGGEPTAGIRVLVKRPFFRQKVFRARRKRTRPDVAAVYPHLPEALASGFLAELQLGFGRNHLVFQVQDQNRVWSTFHSATTFVLPASLPARLGFKNLQKFLISYLKRLTAGRPSASAAETEFKAISPSPVLLATRRVHLFATSKSNLFIVEIGELVAAGFREIGCEAELLLDQVPDSKPAADTLQLVVTPHEFYNLFLRERFSWQEMQEQTRNLFLLCTEQPETGWFQNNLTWGAKARGLADINALGVAAYRRRGLPCHHLPLGYHDMLAHRDATPHQKRDIDIIFLGSMTPRREVFLAENAPFFSGRSCYIRLVPLGFAKTKTTRSYLGADERNDLLNRSRILLNVHYSEQNYFEWHRMLVALANGCCIITETSRGYGPLEPGKHFVMAESEYLIPCCEYYLNNPDECTRIAEQGREFIRSQLRQGQSCQRFLHEIEAAAKAISHIPEKQVSTELLVLPVDPAPHPFPKALVEKFSRHTTRLLGRAIRRDLQGIGQKLRKKPLLEPRLTGTATREATLREQVVQKREGYHARWLKQEALRLRGDPFLDIHENSVFARGGKPIVSVLITLYNYAHFIGDCVASVEKATSKLDGLCDVLIVDDASTDNSFARALQCLESSGLPVRLARKKFNTGLADARNVAISLARAPHVFILDADNLVYPNALQQLYAVITSDDYDAAYSLICRFRGTPENRVGLLSYYDWDPEILVQYPYIDAMAMFRRDALQEGPGYDNHLSQIGWFGWEDYDMWLRFAQRQRRVAFVPNILCLYRHHETSMINTTTLFESDLVNHFLAVYGDLIDRFPLRERVFGIERSKLPYDGEKAVLVRRDGNAG